jgi:hypothetical protein
MPLSLEGQLKSRKKLSKKVVESKKRLTFAPRFNRRRFRLKNENEKA